jgi:hypothetical protein
VPRAYRNELLWTGGDPRNPREDPRLTAAMRAKLTVSLGPGAVLTQLMVPAAGRASARTWCLPGTAQKGYWRKRHGADLSNAVHPVCSGTVAVTLVTAQEVELVAKPRHLAVAGGVLAIALIAAPPAATAEPSAAYPVTPSLAAGIANAIPDPAAAPAGANVPGCHSTAHPIPVVLVNGTFDNAVDDFGGLAPTLANAGYCVCTFDYGAPSSQLIQSIGPEFQVCE